MIRNLRLATLSLALVAGLLPLRVFAAKAPEWLAAAASVPTTVDITDADGVVLLSDRVLDVSRDGTFTYRYRYAFRMLKRDSRSHAVATAHYYIGSSKVKLLKAWLLTAKDKRVVTYDRHDVVDVEAQSETNELYTDAHIQIIAAASDVAQPGDVFGYEVVVEEKSAIAQDIWSFKEDIPVERSSYTINLPEDWQVQVHVFNHEPITPTISGRSQTWTLRDLPGRDDEAFSPSPESIEPWLAIDLKPPESIARSFREFGATTWLGLAQLVTPRYENASQGDGAMAGKAAQLTSGATALADRIHALARYVQKVSYVSISTDFRHAGGYTPRPATKTFQTNYGDCKDKATLLCTLLHIEGIKAYPLIVDAGPDATVQESWPSAMQFNHCIVAVSVDDSVQDPAVINHPVLGRLLICDPTDEFTPPGHLLISSLAPGGLLLAGSDGGFISLKSLLPGEAAIHRRITAHLDPDGGVSGKVTDTAEGAIATQGRGFTTKHTASEFEKSIHSWLASTMPSVSTTDIETTDTPEVNQFVLTFAFNAPHYGKMMRDTLLVFKPALVSRRDDPVLHDKKRLLPVRILANSMDEECTVDLPAGFRVDELPKAVDLDTGWARYTASTRVEGSQLIYKRFLALHDATLPAADGEKVRLFYKQIIQAEQSPVVLASEASAN